jgi:hypothetical protein
MMVPSGERFSCHTQCVRVYPEGSEGYTKCVRVCIERDIHPEWEDWAKYCEKWGPRWSPGWVDCMHIHLGLEDDD